jgi:uncharacterized delta-60 repeat protein
MRGNSRREKCFVEQLEDRRLLSAGDLDHSFNGTGIQTTTFPAAGDAKAVFTQIDGKSVVAGTVAAGKLTNFAVARYNFDGSLDTTFGPNHDGLFQVHIGDSDKFNRVFALTEQSDGKIVVVGRANIDTDEADSDGDIAVIRLNTNGTLDKTFDGDGKVTVDFDGPQPEAVTMYTGGKIIISGYKFGGEGVQGFLVRLNPNGSLDNSFSGDGKLEVSGNSVGFDAVAVDTSGGALNGKIIAAGESGTSHGLVLSVFRFNSNGSVDKTFDGDGSAQVGFPGDNDLEHVSGIVMQGDNIVVSAMSGNSPSGFTGQTLDPVLARFLSTGPLDGSFGTAHTGWVKTDLGGAVDVSLSVAKSNTGNLLVLARKNVTSFDNFAQNATGEYKGGVNQVLSYSPNGILDTTFGASGKATLPTGFLGRGITAGPGNRFMVTSGTGFQSARFLDKGANTITLLDLSPTAKEAGKQPTHLLVTRSERLPIPTRVYLGLSGTATSPLSMFRTLIDYSTNNIVYGTILNGGKTYVDIPANQTFVDITVTPNDDTRIEGSETAIFSALPNPAYGFNGTGGSATITIQDNDSKTLLATADAYVQDGANAGKNFGSANSLQVQKSTSGNEITYLKFDLTNISTVNFGQLRLFGNLVGTAKNLSAGIYGVSTTSWTESGIKFNNKPAPNSSAITSQAILDSIPRWYYFDVTSYLKAQKAAGHNIVSLAVQMTAANSTSASFSAREVVTNQPQLVVG